MVLVGGGGCWGWVVGGGLLGVGCWGWVVGGGLAGALKLNLLNNTALIMNNLNFIVPIQKRSDVITQKKAHTTINHTASHLSMVSCVVSPLLVVN